jgi:hypothetical protein
MSATFNDLSRLAVISGLNEVPAVGGFLGGLVALFWPPSGADIWGEIQSRVEALIDQKLADQVKKDVNATLTGLKTVIQDYKTNVKGSPSDAVAAYTSAEAVFDAAKPKFIDVPGSEVLLLPLTAQLANMHLALLRDGVLFGAKWGRDNAWLKQKKAKLTAQVKEYVDFARTWYINGYISAAPLPRFHQKDLDVKIYGDLVSRAQHASLVPLAMGRHRAQLWTFYNRYVREMSLSVLDYVFYWPSFDPDSAAAKQLPPLTREIFSNAEGMPDSGHYAGAEPAPAQPITNITAWTGNGVTAVQVSYDGAQGPRMGRSDGTVPAGWKGAVTPANPIVRVNGAVDLALNQLEFTFKDGSKAIADGSQKGSSEFSWHFAGHALSSIYVSGSSDHTPAVDCVIFGFRLRDNLDKPAPQLNKTSLAGNWAAGMSIFDYYDQALTLSKLWINYDGDKIRGLAWQYPLGNAFRAGDVPQDLSSLQTVLSLDPGQRIAAITLKDSTYGYGSVQRIEITLENGQIWSAGVDGGHAVPAPSLNGCIAGFYGSVNQDNFINSLGVYVRPAQLA